MECHSIKEKLSAYIENQLSSEEKMQVDEHLKVCSKCSLSLEELKGTIAYIQKLGDIEPPPWLTQKVMARVKEEAEQKKGLLQKLFYPLHIKVPVEVIATLAIAVTAFYVFKSIEPEIRVAQAPSEQVIVSEQEEEKALAKKDESVAYKEALSEVPTSVKKQRLEKEADVLVGEVETQDELTEAKEGKTVPEVAYRALNMKVKKETKEPAVGTKYGLIQDKKEDVVLTLYVKDVEMALKDTEKVINELGGEVVRTESFENKDVVTAELDSKKVKELFEKLKLIGKVKEKDALYALKGDIKIKIEIVRISKELQ